MHASSTRFHLCRIMRHCDLVLGNGNQRGFTPMDVNIIILPQIIKLILFVSVCLQFPHFGNCSPTIMSRFKLNVYTGIKSKTNPTIEWKLRTLTLIIQGHSWFRITVIVTLFEYYTGVRKNNGEGTLRGKTSEFKWQRFPFTNCDINICFVINRDIL